MFIDPTAPQITCFQAEAGADTGPVFMLNLLRFKEQADGIDAGEGLSGAEAYGRYAAATAPHLARVNGELLWAGQAHPALIGPADTEWDVVALVRYPSRAAFLEMVSDPDYLANTGHRTAGLADSRLIPCTGGPLIAS